ncbi:MAG: nucleotidyltransferase domain-containing protein [Bacteroidales bacterium]|nr:nucleotidyltransferase domain-containing protein [Bacteroidales bacterium]
MITREQINNIIEKIAENYAPEKIIIFGSYAKGEQKADSDLDILVIKNTKERFFERVRAVRKAIQPQIIPMDILVYTPEEFEQKKEMINHIVYIINKEGKIFYER